MKGNLPTWHLSFAKSGTPASMAILEKHWGLQFFRGKGIPVHKGHFKGSHRSGGSLEFQSLCAKSLEKNYLQDT